MVTPARKSNVWNMIRDTYQTDARRKEAIMKRTITLAALALISVAALAAGCGGDGKPGTNGGGDDGATYDRPEPPAEYAEKEAPEFTDEMVEEGNKIFQAQCMTCHGAEGKGDAPAGQALTPPAQDLSDPELQDAISDHYIFWRISEGGAALGYTGMTPFKDAISEEDRWKVVAFVRSLKRS